MQHCFAYEFVLHSASRDNPRNPHSAKFAHQPAFLSVISMHAIQRLADAEDSPFTFQAVVSGPTIDALQRLVSLFGLGQILGGLGDFLESGFVTPSQAGLAREAQYQVLRELRPDAVALVDAFAIPDYVLDSSLGLYNGDVYR